MDYNQLTNMQSFPQSFQYSINRYYKAVETPDFVFYAAYQESDDNANVIMFRRSDRSLVSNNYFASQGLLEELENKTFTHMSKTMRCNYREMIKAGQI